MNEIWHNCEFLPTDLLVNELYEKECERRVEVFGVQLDELWSFVGNKENKSQQLEP